MAEEHPEVKALREREEALREQLVELQDLHLKIMSDDLELKNRLAREAAGVEETEEPVEA